MVVLAYAYTIQLDGVHLWPPNSFDSWFCFFHTARNNNQIRKEELQWTQVDMRKGKNQTPHKNSQGGFEKNWCFSVVLLLLWRAGGFGPQTPQFWVCLVRFLIWREDAQHVPQKCSFVLFVQKEQRQILCCSRILGQRWLPHPLEVLKVIAALRYLLLFVIWEWLYDTFQVLLEFSRYLLIFFAGWTPLTTLDRRK